MNMKIEIYKDYGQLSEQVADKVAETVRAKPDAVLCLASGHTPVGVFENLVSLARTGSVDFGRCTFIGLDEWVGIPPQNEGSCYHLLGAKLFNPLNISKTQVLFFDGMAASPQDECRRMDGTIARLGGLDLMLTGIGMNGHIALNEPGTPWHLRSHVVDLDETTQTVGQKYFTKKTALRQGITLGLQYLRESRLTMLMASGEAKAPVVRQALEGEVTERLPASIFQTLENGLVFLDREAAFELGS